MVSSNIHLVNYSKKYLDYSWKWLNDPEIKYLTQTPDFSKEDQLKFFQSLSVKTNYFIKGIEYEGMPIGACGLKNISKADAEYWGYIGEKSCWGKGIGGFILASMIAEAKRRGLKSLYLKVIRDNIRAFKLYERMGFVTEKEDGIMLVMRLIL